MHDEPRQKLRELIIKYGRSLCNDPRRCEALLKDHCGHYKREIFVLVSALKNRVADELLKTSASVPQPILLARLNRQLEEELAMTAEAAHWAVESWALALGIIAQPLPVAKPAPVSTPSPQPIVAKVAPTLPLRPAESLIADRYQDNGDGTVTDVQTGLQWTSRGRTYTWQEALDATDALNRQGGYAGYQDWRVPTKDELQTLISAGQRLPIGHTAFPPVESFWSSTVYTRNPALAWSVELRYGCVYPSKQVSSRRVLLVRGG